MIALPALFLLASAGIGAEPFQWSAGRPEDYGFDAARLHAVADDLMARGTQALLIIRHDAIILERYTPDMARNKRHYTASLAKALVGGMSLALAMDDGLLRPDDLASKFVPAWREVPGKQDITVRHLATHTSGLSDAEHEGLPHEQLPGWMGAFWKRQQNPFLISRDEAPLHFAPGTAAEYSNPGMAMLSWCITAALKGAPDQDMRSLLKHRVMGPLGVPDNEWICGYGRTFDTDGLPLVACWGGGTYSPDAVARVGRLMLHHGDWNGTRLLRSSTVAEVTGDAEMPMRGAGEGPEIASGLGWWLNTAGTLVDLPRDAFYGAGAGHQILLVVPSLDLIVVRMGSDLKPGPYGAALDTYLFEPLMTAVTEGPPPSSDAVRRVRFAPAASIVRAAPGSDNWPLTWADDDALYTSYGDGWGFEPLVPTKLSQGFARLTGPADAFVAENLRSPSGETTGDGPRGAKASGLIMVDGVLYCWTRNVGNAQLMWSVDHGSTWEWGFKLTAGFGCPAFLNRGRNDALAGDDYVYTYSSDGPTAYDSYDQVVLARVPRDKVRELGAYEYYAGEGNDWSHDIARCAGVLRYPGHCQRLDVVYDPGIDRYLMALGFNHDGGWGLFEAPQPWGPWRTAWLTADWGLGGTHGYRLPSKWISPDGRTLALVFSGRQHEGVDYDAFCARMMYLE